VKDTDIIAAIAPDAVSLMDKAIAEIKRLRQENASLTAERDEARRSYCYATGNGYEQRAINVAQSKGWDCFKENTNG
jgi:hypothetical protein